MSPGGPDIKRESDDKGGGRGGEEEEEAGAYDLFDQGKFDQKDEVN